MEEVETDLCLKNRECLDLRKRDISKERGQSESRPGEGRPRAHAKGRFSATGKHSL